MLILISWIVRLQALGYSTSFEMKLNEPEDKFDFVEDFVEKDISK